MSRRHRAPKRDIAPDPKYGCPLIAKFTNTIMWDGKKEVARKIVYQAIDTFLEKTGQQDAREAFARALEQVKPAVEVKSRRVGGANYQVPVEIRPERKQNLAIRWVIEAARGRSGQCMAVKLSNELIDAFNGRGTAFKKKEDTHRNADANKAFAHFRW